MGVRKGNEDLGETKKIGMALHFLSSFLDMVYNFHQFCGTLILGGGWGVKVIFADHCIRAATANLTTEVEPSAISTLLFSTLDSFIMSISM